MNYSAAPARYDLMKYQRCGRSGLLLPRVSLGLWQNFGGVNCYETGRAIVRRAFDLGITHFDLANNYGPPPGSAEENFGRLLRHDLRPYRDEIIISTKAGYVMWDGPYGQWGSRKHLLASLDQSLRRMGLEYVDIFYSHRPDPETPLEETAGALDQAVLQGKAIYAGISNYSPEQTREHGGVAARNGHAVSHPPACLQPIAPPDRRWVDGSSRSGRQWAASYFRRWPRDNSLSVISRTVPADSRAARASFLQEGNRAQKPAGGPGA